MSGAVSLDAVVERLSALKDDLDEHRAEMRGHRAEMSESVRALVQLQERQAATLDAINKTNLRVDEHDRRLMRVETKMPGLIETRTWIISGISALLTIIVTHAVDRANSVPTTPRTSPPAITSR